MCIYKNMAKVKDFLGKSCGKSSIGGIGECINREQLTFFFIRTKYTKMYTFIHKNAHNVNISTIH